MQLIQDYKFKGKKALTRVDFNVPLDAQGRVTDTSRIQAAVPTIHHILNDGGAVVLMAHLGRPQASFDERLSLRQLVPHVANALGTPVAFSPNCVGPTTAEYMEQLAPGEVLLLENVRFHNGEFTNDAAFAQALSAWGDVYVNDAFGTAHRAHASTAAVAAYFQDRVAGYLLQLELENADRILKGTKKPATALIGGAKIADKIKPIAHLLNLVDTLLLGGGVANTFQKALGGQLGASLVEQDQIALAQALIQEAQQKGVRLVLPSDVVIAERVAAGEKTTIVAGNAVPEGWMALDIGPQAREAFAQLLQASQTILWCGPIGVFELDAFRHGTHAVATAITQATAQGAFSLVGGGDSAAAVRSLGHADHVSHLSTGGGALLTYLGGAPLPTVQALMET